MSSESLDCTGYREVETGDLPSDHGRCTIEGDPIDVYVFTSETDMNRWLEIGGRLGGIVTGPNWAISGGDHAPEIADALGGEIR